MKWLKWNILLALFITVFAYSGLYAQYEDEMLGEQGNQAEENCVPKNLTTKWDSLAKKQETQSIGVIYGFGYEYFKNKDYKDALPYLWEVYLKDNGKYARAAVRKIANIYYTRGNVDSALIVCYRGLKRFPSLLRLHHYAGMLQNTLGKFRCAIPHFEELVKKNSTNAFYLKTLAFLYFKDENEKAIDIQEKLIKLEPDNADEANTLAQYVSHFRGEGADLDLRKETWQKAPNNISFALSYAKAAANAGKFKDALAPLAKVVKEKPSSSVYLLRAEVYENLNMNAKAIADYKRILKIDPKNANVMLRIAVDYRNKNDFSSARYWVRKALSAKPHYGLAYITMGEIYEGSVLYCQDKRGGEIKYEDKLVYEKALNQYKLAKRDPAFRAKAAKKIENVRPFIPTEEDRFMHKKDKITSPCYNWLK